MIQPEINDYGGAPVATHNHACTVCLKRPSVLNLSTGRMEPCWECQREGWRITRLSRFWRRVWRRSIVIPVAMWLLCVALTAAVIRFCWVFGRTVLPQWFSWRRRTPALVRDGVPHEGGRGVLREAHVAIDAGRGTSGGRFGAKMIPFAPPIGVWTPEDPT